MSLSRERLRFLTCKPRGQSIAHVAASACGWELFDEDQPVSGLSGPDGETFHWLLDARFIGLYFTLPQVSCTAYRGGFWYGDVEFAY